MAGTPETLVGQEQTAPQRITLNLSPEAADRLRKLAQSTQKSLGEVIRQSLSLESLVRDEIQKGSKILIKEKDGTMREIRLR